MSQKELNYIEDIYNHQQLLIDAMNEATEIIDDNNYIELFDINIDVLNNLQSKIEKMLGECNE